MTADRCVMCGAIIPEGTQVCINCLNGCNGCGWESKENCRACRMGNKLQEILDKEKEKLDNLTPEQVAMAKLIRYGRKNKVGDETD